MPAVDEKALIERARAGDRAALGELLQHHQRRLYTVCLRMVSHPDDAAELTQDAMVRIVQSLEGFRGDARLTTWMTRIAMNLSISHLRKRKLRRAVSLDAEHPGSNGRADAASSLVSRLADDSEPGPACRVQDREMHDHLQRAIAALDDEQRAVLVLRDVEQLDYLQIAHTLDLPVGTVKSRLFRARLALRERMNAGEPASPKLRVESRKPE